MRMADLFSLWYCKEIMRSAPLARGFLEAVTTLHLSGGGMLNVDLRLSQLASRTETVTMTANVSEVDVLAPDPAMRVFATQDLLDANPGRPGAPISIPGYPIETASSGIKAPQFLLLVLRATTASRSLNFCRWVSACRRTNSLQMRTVTEMRTRMS